MCNAMENSYSILITRKICEIKMSTLHQELGIQLKTFFLCTKHLFQKKTLKLVNTTVGILIEVELVVCLLGSFEHVPRNNHTLNL